jgi:hypothetical protein
MADAPESRAQQMARQRAYGQDFLRLYRRAGSLKRWRAQFPPTEAEKELGKLRLAEWQRRHPLEHLVVQQPFEYYQALLVRQMLGASAHRRAWLSERALLAEAAQLRLLALPVYCNMARALQTNAFITTARLMNHGETMRMKCNGNKEYARGKCPGARACARVRARACTH